MNLMFLITGPTYPECVTEKLVKLVSLSLTQYSQSVTAQNDLSMDFSSVYYQLSKCLQ